MNIKEFIITIVMIEFLVLIIGYIIVGYVNIKRKKKREENERMISELRNKIKRS